MQKSPLAIFFGRCGSVRSALRRGANRDESGRRRTPPGRSKAGESARFPGPAKQSQFCFPPARNVRTSPARRTCQPAGAHKQYPATARYTRKMLAPTIIVQIRVAAISPPGTQRPARFGRAAFTFCRSLYLSVPLLYHSIRALTAFLPNFEKFSLFDILFVYSMPSPRDTWRIAPGILFEQAVFLAGIGVRPRFLSFVLFCKI